MRAKIVFRTDMSIFDLQARFKEHNWLPKFSQDSEEAHEIKKAILDKVAPEHHELAEKGALFVIHETKRDASD